jgi:carbamoyl-phosphate synthase large subunit
VNAPSDRAASLGPAAEGDRARSTPERILVTGAGSGPSNNLMRSLVHADASTYLIGCHSDRFLLKKSAAQRNFLIPALDEDVAAGASALRTVVDRAHVDLVIPGNDRDARALAALQESEPLACRTFVPALRTIDTCQDKYVLSHFLRERGIPAPLTYALTSRGDVAQAWEALDPGELAWCRIRRGFASRGATKVKDPEQAWGWISYWHTMRGVPVEDFTLCEYLPGRDFNVQGLWLRGRLVLIKMCERLSYLNADQQPSGMASTPALAKTVWEAEAIDACAAALAAIDPAANGVFNFDLKENHTGVACITEINAGRFAMITNIYDLTGRHNMASTYVRLAYGQDVRLADPHDHGGEHYLVRDLDTLPGVFNADELFEEVERV